MALIRHRTRHFHHTLVLTLRTGLDARDWITPPINFNTQEVTVLDYQPDDRNLPISQNTVAISVGDVGADDDEELGTSIGGARSARYPIYVDAWMSKQAHSVAICDDIRDIFTDGFYPLINHIDGTQVPGSYIEINAVYGPERPSGATGSDAFKKYWRTMRLDAVLYYST